MSFSERRIKKVLLYLYRPDFLERDLGCPEARRILEDKGYCCSSAGKCIVQLIRHMTEDDEFPHEVGLFLGYPPGDVQCFMQDSRHAVIRKFKNYKAQEIVDYMHEEKAYQGTNPGEIIPFSMAKEIRTF